MSAYVVDRNHILFLIAAAQGFTRGGDFYWYSDGPHMLDVADSEQAAKAANMLWQENVKSVSHRYPQDTLEQLPGPVGEVFHIEPSEILMHWDYRLEPTQVIASCQCYKYQSCEHDEWESSSAKAFVDALIIAAIDRLPNYDKTIWGAPEPVTIAA
jgi:hypothetical protein